MILLFQTRVIRMSKMSQITELDMVNIFLELHQYKTYRFITEVPVYSRCVDVVSYNRNRCTISAIEFKKNKWKDAIQQVLRVANSFDFIEICILKPSHASLMQEIKNICENNGIGVYFLDEEKRKVEHIVKPKKTTTMWKLQKKEVLKYLNGRIEKDG